MCLYGASSQNGCVYTLYTIQCILYTQTQATIELFSQIVFVLLYKFTVLFKVLFSGVPEIALFAEFRCLYKTWPLLVIRCKEIHVRYLNLTAFNLFLPHITMKLYRVNYKAFTREI